MPLAVISQREQLLVGRGNAVELCAVAVMAVLVLVEVIAKMQHGVEIVSPRERGIYVEVAERQIRTRHDANADAVDAGCRQRARSTDRRLRSQRFEPVVVRRAWFEAGHV